MGDCWRPFEQADQMSSENIIVARPQWPGPKIASKKMWRIKEVLQKLINLTDATFVAQLFSFRGNQVLKTYFRWYPSILIYLLYCPLVPTLNKISMCIAIEKLNLTPTICYAYILRDAQRYMSRLAHLFLALGSHQHVFGYLKRGEAT